MFERLANEVLALGGELILVSDQSPEVIGAPSQLEHVRVVYDSGDSVFALRAAGLRAARAAIVAVTEDHAAPAPGWCAQVLVAHARHPGAGAIAGAVENGSRHRLVDWASFLVTNGWFMPPLSLEPGEMPPPISNVSLKRRVLAGRSLAPGEFEFDLLGELTATRDVVFDGAMRVHHIQSLGLIGTLRAHFDNGRSVAGLALAGQTWRQRRRLSPQWLRFPVELSRLVRRTLNGKQLPPRARASVPLVPLMCLTASAGVWAGVIAGPGASPSRVY
jgi:hypothetical protein